MATIKVTPDMVEKGRRADGLGGAGCSDGVDIARQVAADPDAAAILTNAQTAASIVRTVRTRLGISQAASAARYHIPIGSLRDWEQARKHPDAPALAYLRVIAKESDMTARALAVTG